MVYVVVLTILVVVAVLMPQHVDALVIGVPIIAIAVIQFIGVVVSVLSVPLAFLVKSIKKDWRWALLITLALLCIVALVILGVVKVFQNPDYPFSLSDLSFSEYALMQLLALVLSFVYYTIFFFLGLFVPVLGVMLISSRGRDQSISKRRIIGITILTIIVVAMVTSAIFVVYQTVKKGTLF